jgi:hypothetical protein
MTLVQTMVFLNTWLRHGFFRVEIHGLLDHHLSHFVIWGTTNFVLVILYIIITFLWAMISSCYLLAMQKVCEDFVTFLATY